MNPVKKSVCRKHRGVVLIISMIFVLVFSVLAVSMASLSGTNLQISDNHHKANSALSAATSGLEIMRYHLDGISIPESVLAEDRLATVATKLQNNLASAGMTNFTVSYNAATDTLTIAEVTLDSQSGQTFSATLIYAYPGNFDMVQMDTFGSSNQLNRKIRTNFNFTVVGNPIFEYGIVTKGALAMDGNVDVEGLNEDIEASVYIEGLSAIATDALTMSGKSEIAGDVSIYNPSASVAVGDSSSVGGGAGDDAMDHIHIGVPLCEFPVPNVEHFESYVGDNTLDPTIDYTTITNITLENVRILAGTNPHFAGSTIIKGIMFVETPNIVEFSGNATIIGIIIGDGDLDAPSAENQLLFTGSLESQTVSELPDEGFDDIKEETGTFILAPGFSASFGGSFDTLNGTIAASGISFYGNAGGTINGSVLNYAETPMTMDGNTDLIFNSSGTAETPAGFEPYQVLDFVASSYSEIPL